MNDIFTSYKPITIPAINLLATDPSFDRNSNYNKCVIRSLLPFLGDALSWLTGTATTKDVNSIKKRVKQLIAAQSMQKEAMVHIASILHITRYATQVTRQHINIIRDTVDKMVHDVNNLYNITTSLSTNLEPVSTGTPHQIHFSEPLGFPIMYQISFHSYNGLH